MMMLSDFVNKVAQLDQDVARLKEVEYHACSFFFLFVLRAISSHQ
jgi:hypothetical protein